MTRVAALFALLALAACSTATGAGRADTLAPGAWEAGASATAGLHLAKRAPGRPVPLPGYALGAAARTGVARGLDVGGRAWASAVPGLSNAGLLLDGKLQVVSGRQWDASTSVGASLARLGVGGAPTWSVGVPVRLAMGFSPGGGPSQVVFGPAFAAELLLAPNARPVSIGWSGAFVGFMWQVHERFELRPELSVRYSPVSWDGLVDNKERRGLTQVELSLGGAFEW